MSAKTPSGPLAGLRIIEFAGIGPAPMCGMVLSDLGADIIRIDRQAPANVGIERPLDTNFTLRGRRTIKLDLKNPQSVAFVLELVAKADCTIEGFRPGVMERLGLGPEIMLERNPSLVYGRVTGWGQSGPLAMTAGHDINYIAITGALEAMGREGERPPVPLNLIGDFAGGAMFLAVGLLAAVFEARRSGKGQVVDAAIVDGVASMMNSINGLRSGGVFSKQRGRNVLDSGAFFYDTYRCADDRFIALGPIEPQFFKVFLDRLGLSADALPRQDDKPGWGEGRARLAEIFASRPRDEWASLFSGSDACVSPVLGLEEAFCDSHMSGRGAYVEIDGLPQSSPAPRFSRTKPDLPMAPAEATSINTLADWLSADRLAAWDKALAADHH